MKFHTTRWIEMKHSSEQIAAYKELKMVSGHLSRQELKTIVGHIKANQLEVANKILNKWMRR